jgi:peptide/nickel transport system permease protein
MRARGENPLPHQWERVREAPGEDALVLTKPRAPQTAQPAPVAKFPSVLAYLLRRLLLTPPTMLGVALVCFALVHLAPGDPLVSVLPPDASAELQKQLMALYGFDRSLPEQFGVWVWRALHGDLGTSIASGRPVAAEVLRAVGNTLMLATAATAIGFFFGALFGFVAGYFRDSWVDKLASATAVFGVSVPHYWLGMVLVIVFAVQLNWLPPSGAGPGGSDVWVWDWEHVRHLILPAVTMSVIPMSIIARTVRALVAEALAQEWVVGLRAKGLTDFGVFRHVVKNVAPTALAVMGLQLGYLLGGSILIETVFSWPGTGFLLNSAIFQRDLPLLQGTILVLAMFFVVLNVLVDLVQTALDPRIARA